MYNHKTYIRDLSFKSCERTNSAQQTAEVMFKRETAYPATHLTFILNGQLRKNSATLIRLTLDFAHRSLRCVRRAGNSPLMTMTSTTQYSAERAARSVWRCVARAQPPDRRRAACARACAPARCPSGSPHASSRAPCLQPRRVPPPARADAADATPTHSPSLLLAATVDQ